MSNIPIVNESERDLISENERLQKEVEALSRECKKYARELRTTNMFLDKVTKSSNAKDSINVALSASNAKQHSYIDMLLESCPNIIMLLDYEGKFVLSTNAFMSETNIPNFDYINGLHFEEVLPKYLSKESMAMFSDAFSKVVSTGEFHHFDGTADFNNSGIPRHFSFELDLAETERNHTPGVIFVMTDFTDLLIEKQRVETANTTKSAFLAAMSHEIRTPLNAIVGLSEMLTRSQMSPQQMDYVGNIKAASTSLLYIVNDLLDFSKVESGKMEIIDANFNIKIMLDNLYSMFKMVCNEKSLTLEAHISDDFPTMVWSDEHRIRQILSNLLSNAAKYTKTGGVTLSAYVKDGFLRFDIKDTGIGIKDENRATMFQPFERFDTHKNKSIVGTGLGLAITLNLCRAMEGELWFESVYGEGSTFHVSLPYLTGDEPEFTEIPETSDFIAPEARILVVDDVFMNLTVAEALLSTFEIVPDLAIGGQEALELLETNKYDLIFMDHMMPEMDGIEATKHIRNLNSDLSSVPIVALTANAIKGAERMFIENGMDDILTKPVEMSTLNLCLKKWLPSHLINYIVASDKYSPLDYEI